MAMYEFFFWLVSHTKVTNVVDTVGPAVVAIKHRDGRGQVAMAALFAHTGWLSLVVWMCHVSKLADGCVECVFFFHGNLGNLFQIMKIGWVLRISILFVPDF